jgi:hypothetical protein
MLALLTSCSRYDLLKQTVDSLFENQTHNLSLLINEDSTGTINEERAVIKYSKGIGQHLAIESVIKHFDDKYYLHLEDDWFFTNTYNWIAKSLEILKNNPHIIKVICRKDYEHPCKFNADGWGILEPWNDPWKGHEWFGFGWNPGITKLDILKQFTPFPKTEQEISKQIYMAGYRTALLEHGVCIHIGGERSTHEI